MTPRILLEAVEGARLDAERNLADARAEKEAHTERASTKRMATRHKRGDRTAASGWTVLGIDPGLKGAVALIRAWRGRDTPQLEALADTSDLVRVRQLVPEADLVIVEAQSASPQQGVVSAFTLGVATGRLQEAVQAGLRGKAVLAYPARWRASYGLAGGQEGKVSGMKLVARLLGTTDAVFRHDEADAVLLAWWGWRHVLLAQVVQEEAGSRG